MNQSTTGIGVVNKAANIMYTVIATALSLANIYVLIVGNQSAAITIALTAYLVILAVVLWVLYKGNPDTELIRHFIAVGFGLYYTVNCFIANQRLVFVYAIPLLLLLGMYNDVKFSTLVSVICSSVAVVHSVYVSYTNGWAPGEVDAMLIEAIIMIIFASI